MKHCIFALLCYLLIGIAGFLFLEKNKNLPARRPNLLLGLILAAAFGVRLYFSLQDVWFTVDLKCFVGWSDATFDYGFDQIYQSGIYLDYPPGYLYVLYVIKLLRSFFDLKYGNILTICITKLPSVIADLAGSLFLYRLAKERFSESRALFVSALFAFCPATIYNSSVWGQIDSFYTLLLILTLDRISHHKTVQAAVLYALALITKPQALLFGPVLLFYIIEKGSLKEFFKAAVTGLVCVYLLILPFSRGLSPLWILELYLNTFGTYPYMSLNGYNLYTLLGLNRVPLSDFAWSGLINPLVISACLVLCAVGYFRQKETVKNYSVCLVFISVFYSFCTMMHERYLHPVLILTMICYVLTDRKGYFYLFLANTAVNFLNVAAVLLEYEFFRPVPKPLYLSVSALTVASCVYAVILFIRQWRTTEKPPAAS